MTVSKTARLNLTRWSADTDPWDRADWDADNASLEALAAIGRTGLIAARGTAATWPRSTYYATDQKSLAYSDGAAWRRIVLADLAHFPQHASIPAGSATLPNAVTALGDADTVLTHTLVLPGGANVNSIAIANGDGAAVELSSFWFAIYDWTGAKLATTLDNAGTLSSNATRAASFAGAGFTVPTPGRYTILVRAAQTGGATFPLVGVQTNRAIASTDTFTVAGIGAPATAPADISGYGRVQRDAVPWLGFGLDA